MRNHNQVILGLVALAASAHSFSLWAIDRGHHTPLVPIVGIRILQSAPAFPGGRYEPPNIIDGVSDGGRTSEYASASQGLQTFIDFDLGRPVEVLAFQHVDRYDPATVDAAQLVFSSTADFHQRVATVDVDHVNTRGGTTLLVLPKAVTARYVRWQVTALGPGRHGSVGGTEIAFYSPGKLEPLPTADRIDPRAIQAILRQDGGLVQPVTVTVRHPYAEPADAVLAVSGVEPIPLHLKAGSSETVEVLLPAVESETQRTASLEVAGKTVIKAAFRQSPVRPWVLYFLPHSHVDIGYTHVQTEVEQLQWKHLETAIEIARRTADYPPEARYHWNSETLWAVDSYLQQAPADRRAALINAVRKGWVHLDGLYGNELTGLCRPEELMRLTDCARRISRQHGLTIDAAMISDVPGYTWGLVPAMAEGGIKYLSMGPNHGHRIGYTLEAWGDKPFYWVSPSGQHKVLCWMAGKAYSWFHRSRVDTLVAASGPAPFFGYLDELMAKDYPYDMVQVRYSIGGDNGPPDAELSEFVKRWNAKYVSPRMAITTTSALMHQFERRYGDRLPEVRGDFTPYWEDGAASSAAETSMARMASERLVEAEALWAMLRPGEYPVDEFYAAWRNVILYNEHTWGANCSITKPDDPFTLSQWKIKQAFATSAESQSSRLRDRALAKRRTGEDNVTAIDVYNTASWPRTELVAIPAGWRVGGLRVTDEQGHPVPSMAGLGEKEARSGAHFLAENVPPFGAKRFLIGPGEPFSKGQARAEGNVLSNGNIRVEIDAQTGAIFGLTWNGAPVDLVDRSGGARLNQYVYVLGRDPKPVPQSGEVSVRPLERGPLAASLVVETKGAPGSSTLVQAVRVVDGIDKVEITNTLMKTRVLDKEAVHLAFPFHVPGGVMRMDIPWGVIRPEIDQMPGACKNYFTVGRWVDVSNDEYGVTWATSDAPMVEVGRITMDVSKPFQPEGWIKHLSPTQSFYSYAMNNYWETNYKASQEGGAVFHYAIKPHRRYDPVAAARLGMELSQPLIVVPVEPRMPVTASRLRVEPESVMVTSLKPSDDHRALMVRLFNASDQPAPATVTWGDPMPSRILFSGPAETPGRPATGPIDLPRMGIVTLRAEWESGK